MCKVPTDAPALKLQAVVRCLTWVVGTGLLWKGTASSLNLSYLSGITSLNLEVRLFSLDVQALHCCRVTHGANPEFGEAEQDETGTAGIVEPDK